MEQAPSTDELFAACAVLFGPDIHVSLDFINYLQPAGLKAAYRRKVLATHPDRANATGENAVAMKADFIEATRAYQRLRSVVMNGSIPDRAQTAGIVREPRGAGGPETTIRKPSDTFYTGTLPKRKLLICQFLYYSGCISWDAYINALVWQRRQRPPVGRIARDAGLLSEANIRAILSGREPREKFGESAIRLGYLTHYNLMALLGRQRRLQRFICEYFVRFGVLSKRQVEEMVKKQAAHNKGK